MDLRQSERSPSNTPAVIRTEDAALTIPCVVCNLSEGGARLVVEGSDPLPTEFILFLRSDSPVGRRCQKIWRIGDKVGVRFDSGAEFGQKRTEGLKRSGA